MVFFSRILSYHYTPGLYKYKIQNGKVTIDDQEFELNTKKSISLSFDEEHRVAEQELYKYRMELLSALVPTLFLSATPSMSTHKHIKENDGLLKTLSLKDKMKSGVYGALNLQVHTKVKSKDLAEEYSNGVEEYVDFKPEENDKYSNANLTDDELKKEVENYLYRNVQSVIGEPALILAKSNKQIDNLKEILKYGRDETLLKLSGSKFLDFLSRMLEPNLDYKLITKSKKFTLITKQVAKRFNITKEKASEIVKEYYDFSGITDYSVFRVMHGIIENTLSCLTGLNRHELDEKRRADLESLVGEVKAALEPVHDLKEGIK